MSITSHLPRCCRHWVPVKHQCDSTWLQGVTSQKTAVIIGTALRTLNLAPSYLKWGLVDSAGCDMHTSIWSSLTCSLWLWGTDSIFWNQVPLPTLHQQGTALCSKCSLLNAGAEGCAKDRKTSKARGTAVPALIYAVLFCLTVAEVPKECKEWKQSTGWIPSQQPAWSEDAFQIRGEDDTSRADQTLQSSSHRCFVCWNLFLFSFSLLVEVFTGRTDCLFVLSG